MSTILTIIIIIIYYIAAHAQAASFVNTFMRFMYALTKLLLRHVLACELIPYSGKFSRMHEIEHFMNNRQDIRG